MDGWQPQSPGIWIGEGSRRLFAAQAPGQWILRDADGAELRRSRTLAGLVAEHGPIEPSEGASTPLRGPAPRTFHDGSVTRRVDTEAARHCARLSDRPWSACRPSI